MRFNLRLYLVASVLCGFGVAGYAAPVVSVKTEHFDRDPGWDAYQNRQMPAKLPIVKQDFGFSETNHAGQSKGEIGGIVQRVSVPSWYALKLEKPLSLDGPIQLSGNFSVPAARGGGVHFGLFNVEGVRTGGRPLSSMRLDISGAKKTVLVHIRVNGPDNRAAGTLAPPPPRKAKKASGIPADGSRHHFVFEFDPRRADGRGEFRARIDDLPEGRFELSDELRRQHFSFTHLGIMNTVKSGSPMEIYFDDISLNGRSFSFDQDPDWESHGNREQVEDRTPAGVQQYGFTRTDRAGSKPGELGGILWNRQNKISYYGDRVGPFSLEDRLEASGTISLWVGGADSQAYVGFFNADSLRSQEGQNILAVVVTAPTRIGHWLRPTLMTQTGTRIVPPEGPVLAPDQKPHRWKLAYDPAAGKAGVLTVTLDGHSVLLNVPPNLRKQGARFDHFGLFSGLTGGGQEELYLDDLVYSASH